MSYRVIGPQMPGGAHASTDPQDRPGIHFAWFALPRELILYAEYRMTVDWWRSSIAFSRLLGVVACSDNRITPDQNLTIYGSAGKPPSLLSGSRATGHHNFMSLDMAGGATDSAAPKAMPIKMYAL